MLDRKNTLIYLIIGMMKKTVSMSEHFPELKSSKANLKFELDLSNYETKARFKKMQRELINQLLLIQLI